MKKNILALLLVAIIAQPLTVSAYGGGFPPVIGPGPDLGKRLELIEKRLGERMQTIRARLAALEERINDRLDAVRERLNAIAARRGGNAR